MICCKENIDKYQLLVRLIEREGERERERERERWCKFTKDRK